MLQHHPRLIINAGILSVGMLTSVAAYSGVFTGYESDTQNTRLLFVGGQTQRDVFLHFFAANLEYEYLDGATLTKVENRILNLALGFRFGNHNNYSFLIGPGYNHKHEQTSVVESDEQRTGAFYQFGANTTASGSQYEFLSSYTSLDRFVWSRGRYKTHINTAYSAGAELFWMGNDDGDSWGGGVLLEHSAAYANTGIKAGYKRSTNDEPGSYFGLEAYFPF